MTFINKSLKWIFLVTIGIIYSCSSEGTDLIAPLIEEVSYTPMPQEDKICGVLEPAVFRLTGGDELNFDLLLTDDQALAQYKVDIHNNFDCHGHGGGSAPNVSVPNVDNQTDAWTVLDIVYVTGTSASVNRTLAVPENVTAGNYHFHIQVIDESGNDSPFTNFYALKVKNPLDDIAPQISIQQPPNSNLIVSKGGFIHFEGEVTDNRSLSDGGNGVLYLAYTDLSSGNTFATDVAFPFDMSVGTNFTFDFEYKVPHTLVSGDYRFSLGANDGVRNVAPFVFFNVQVTN